MPARGRRGEKGGEKWASENRKMCVMYIHMKDLQNLGETKF